MLNKRHGGLAGPRAHMWTLLSCVYRVVEAKYGIRGRTLVDLYKYSIYVRCVLCLANYGFEQCSSFSTFSWQACLLLCNNQWLLCGVHPAPLSFLSWTVYYALFGLLFWLRQPSLGWFFSRQSSAPFVLPLPCVFIHGILFAFTSQELSACLRAWRNLAFPNNKNWFPTLQGLTPPIFPRIERSVCYEREYRVGIVLFGSVPCLFVTIVTIVTIALIVVISGLTCERGERVNAALYWPFSLVCVPL